MDDRMSDSSLQSQQSMSVRVILGGFGSGMVRKNTRTYPETQLAASVAGLGHLRYVKAPSTTSSCFPVRASTR